MATIRMGNRIFDDLRLAYDRAVQEREYRVIPPWKLGERARFLAFLQAEEKRRVLEIGAGTGQDSQYFRDQGLQVVSVDLSRENVRYCRDKGLAACEMDFLRLGFSEECLDGAYAVNCLLHVPPQNLDEAMVGIHRVIKANGLFYLGQLGGLDFEGTWPEDHYRPKRYYSLLSDAKIQDLAGKHFEIVSFTKIRLGPGRDTHFHSMILRRNAQYPTKGIMKSKPAPGRGSACPALGP